LSLGELYEGGWGVEQDYPRAYSLFNAAAKNGDKECARLRGKLEEKMSTDQITEAKMLEPIW
jgi:TPR repeat protein